MSEQHQYVMACIHVLEDNQGASDDQFPDLLCENCCNRMIDNDLPNEVHLVCRNCVLKKVARK